MKINIVTLLIAFAIAALAGYALYAANDAQADIPLANALGGGLAFFVTLAGAIAVGSKDGKGSTMNLRLSSWVFFFVILAEQIIFSLAPFRIAPYIVVTGLLTLIYVLTVYAIGKSMR